MSAVVSHLHSDYRLDAPAPAFKSLRPESWPPPRDWVVSEDRAGRPVSRWGDPVWDFSALAGKALRLNFGDGTQGRAGRLDGQNADLLRLVIGWLIWGPGPVRALNTVKQAFATLRPLFALCSREGILASELNRFPRVLERIPEVLSPSGFSSAIYRLHRLLDARDELGFVLVDAQGLKRLAAAAPDREVNQTPYVPPHIWRYQVARLRNCLEDYLAHQKAVESCFNFCLDAYAHNYGSLEEALAAEPVNSRLPFQAPRRTGAGTRAGVVFHGPFEATAARFGLTNLLNRWVEPVNGRLELRQLSTYLTLIQWTGVAYIANFSLQRIEEAMSLRADCLQFEDDEKLGRVPILCGETTKTVQDSDARWPTSPSVQVAVDAAASVARLRTRCARALPVPLLTESEADNPPLLLRSCEPWTPRSSRSSALALKSKLPYLSAFSSQFPKVFDLGELTIRERDLVIARRLTPGLPEDEFAVGKVWPLAWHQLRRTGAVNMFASGLLSDSSMQYLMKHSSRLMPLYYGRGYTQLHLNEEVAGLVTAAMYEVMAESVLSSMGERFVSPASSSGKNVAIVNIVSGKDSKALASAARRGEVPFRETRLGFCTSREVCTYGGLESVSRCAGGDGRKPCADALFDKQRVPFVERDLERVNSILQSLPADSPRHAALLQERQALENFLDVVNN